VKRAKSTNKPGGLNPKSQAPNPKQIPISKFKAQNLFGHWDFEHLIFFSISNLGFRLLFS
jgi:hypothetical protein